MAYLFSPWTPRTGVGDWDAPFSAHLQCVQCGFSEFGFFDSARLLEAEAKIREIWPELSGNGYELIPQTMPPFPWHFGGQKFHNLFVTKQQITDFCSEVGARVCLDISHSKLACNNASTSFSSFLKEVAPFVAHMHVADGMGVDGEGLQLGDGEIDFQKIWPILDELCPNASFIPEVWQGHKNQGAGFKVAFNTIMKHV